MKRTFCLKISELLGELLFGQRKWQKRVEKLQLSHFISESQKEGGILETSNFLSKFRVGGKQTRETTGELFFSFFSFFYFLLSAPKPTTAKENISVIMMVLRNNFELGTILFGVLWVARLWGSPLDSAPVSFERLEVDSDLVGDYWVVNSDVDHDGLVDLIAIAYQGEGLFWYKNPGKTTSSWEKSLLAQVSLVVAMDEAGDLNRDGFFPDYVVAYNFSIPGTSQTNSSIGGGTAGWIENPGPRNLDKPWKIHPIENIPSLHRILYSQDLNSGQGAIIAAPIFGATPLPPTYLNEPVQIALLLRPEDLDSPWKYVAVPLPTPLHSVHAFIRAPSEYQVEGSLRILTGAQEGLFDLEFNDTDLSVKQTFLVAGAPLYSYSPYSGVNGVDVCKFQNSTHYLATIGPWEGVNILTPPTIQVHTSSQFPLPLSQQNKEAAAASPLFDTRTLTIQGPQAHVVVCGDFTGDGNDEFLVGMRGPVKTIQMYQPPLPLETRYSWWDLALDAEQVPSLLIFLIFFLWHPNSTVVFL